MSETLSPPRIYTREAAKPTLEELRGQLNDARVEWARISAKRQNRLYDRKIHGYNAAQEKYNKLVIEYGRQSLAEKLKAAADVKERNLMATTYVVEMQSELRDETNKITDNKASRKFGRAIGKWFTTGSKKMQFAKSAAVSAAAGIVGGVAGATVATLAAMRFSKGYLTSEISGLGSVDSDAIENEVSQQQDFETVLDRAQAKSAEIFETAGGDQQTKKRAAVRRGLGVMTVGFVVGGTIGSLIDSIDTPRAHAAPVTGDHYANPGIGNYESPGIASAEPSTNPGVTASGAESANPGLTTAEFDNPGVSEASDDSSSDNPGTDSAEYYNPGLSEVRTASADTYFNPGIQEVESTSPGTDTDKDTYHNPGIEEQDDRADKPADTEKSNTYYNPGVEVDTNGDDSRPETVDLADTFKVEHGNGYVHEIIDAAKAHGIEMSPEEAWQIHQHIVDKVGTDYINLTDHSGADTYSMGDSKYETGIAAPGEAEWNSRALNIMETEFADLDRDDADAESSADTGTQEDSLSDEDTSADSSNDVAEFAENRDESSIAPEETGHEFAREIGIESAEDQADVWSETAPDLKESGVSYFDKANDEWRLAMTEDGVMPTSAIEAMAQTAAEKDIDTDYSHLIDGESDSNGESDESDEDENDAESADAQTFTLDELKGNLLNDNNVSAYHDVLKDIDPDHRAALLNEAANSLQYMKDDGGNAFVTRENGEWRFRDVERISTQTENLLKEIANQKNWTKAA